MKEIYHLTSEERLIISSTAKYLLHICYDGKFIEILESATGKVLYRLQVQYFDNYRFSDDDQFLYYIGISKNQCIFRMNLDTGIVDVFIDTKKNNHIERIPATFELFKNHILVKDIIDDLNTKYGDSEISLRNINLYNLDGSFDKTLLTEIDYLVFDDFIVHDNQMCLFNHKEKTFNFYEMNTPYSLKSQLKIEINNYNNDFYFSNQRLDTLIVDVNKILSYETYNRLFETHNTRIIVIKGSRIVKEFKFKKIRRMSHGFYENDAIYIYVDNILTIYDVNTFDIILEKDLTDYHIDEIQGIHHQVPLLIANQRLMNASRTSLKTVMFDYSEWFPNQVFEALCPVKPLAFKLIEGMDTSSLPDYLEYGLKAIDIEVMKHRQLDDEHYIVIDKHDTYYLVIVESNIIKEVHLIKEVTLKDVYHEPITKRKAIKGIKQVISEGDIEDKALNRVYHMVLMKYEYTQPNSIQYKRETAYLNEIMRQIAIDLEALKDQTINYIGVQYSNEEGYYDSSIMLGFDDSSEMPAGMKYGREFIMGEYLEGKEKKLVEDYSKMIEKKKKYEDYRELMSTKLYTLLKAKYPDKSIEIFELSD